MLLDDLVARRDRPEVPEEAPGPVLTIEPVAVPLMAEPKRGQTRQRITELEATARRNFKSAEEARTVLAREHERLQLESSARAHAEDEAGALRRELGRLRAAEEKRGAEAKAVAARAAREEIAAEIKRFHDEHDRVVRELDLMRGSLTDHNGLIEEYASRLREEQQGRAALRAELEAAETARRLAERSLERAAENAQKHAEHELITIATLESELGDTRSDRDRLAAQLADLTDGEGAIARMQTTLTERDAELTALRTELAEITELFATAERERDDAVATRDAALSERAGADVRRDELSRALEESQSERAALQARLADVQEEIVRARADGDRLRAHAAALGDELAAVRASVAVLQAAAPAPVVDDSHGESPAVVAPGAADAGALTESSATGAEVESAVTPEPVPEVLPPLQRRRRRSDDAVHAAAHAAASIEVPGEAPPPLPTRHADNPGNMALVAALEAASEPEPVCEPESTPEPERRPLAAPVEGFRRTAMAELAGIASGGDDDFAFRRR